MKKWIVFIFVSLSVSYTLAQKNTIVTIDQKPISIEEFEYYYNKNNTNDLQQKMPVEEYMQLFVNFKLKVHQAYMLQMDTAQTFKQELEGYRNQLIKPYLTDNEKIDDLVKEAYQHLLEDVDVSHILIRLNANPTPADTIAAYTKAMTAYKRVTNGESFEKIAVEFSEDPTVQENKGRLGFITGMMVVYPFEKTAYTTPVGQVSAPIRTRFGYHIIKVHDKRKTQGERLVAHILKRIPEDASEKQKAAIERSIKSIYEDLAKGADFQRLAQANSDDQSSANKGGEISWVGTGKTTPEFENAVFNLQNIGDISQPVKTEFGWHIIKLLDKRDIMTLQEAYPLIEPRVKTDERASIIANSFIEKLKKTYNFKSYPTNLHALHTLLAQPNDNILEQTKTYNLPIYTFADQVITQSDLIVFLHQQNYTKNPIDLSLLDILANQVANNTIIKYENSMLEKKYPEFGLLMNEYKEGILLFNISNEMVWSKASKDIEGLTDFFEKNKKSYAWDKPRFKGAIIYCDSKQSFKTAKKIAKATPEKELSTKLKQTLNSNEKNAVKIETGLFAEQTNPVVDKLVFKKGKLEKNNDYPYIFTSGNIQKHYPDSYQDIRGIVINDYQNYLDKQWIEELRSKYPIVIDTSVLNSLKSNNE
ncbi:MAG: peptidylprolyl isomerase [Paludibacteraceae bacterium]|nr:peptidylprolyl isomerase [Paludibacteraceae bacterium]MBP6435902.1 peptidylprolyl isomerase [Paludibacteraceae bacterium]MBP7218840.1 peptidylprolyl isomerase [Paludibacteraceae bacterium]MBP8627302.1 peptidylprolyl isomerase [Paludibacteraceae bacterium]MBP8781182.1 peptidylprolyl isomerase [Paludibacteraceae bacterium]